MTSTPYQTSNAVGQNVGGSATDLLGFYGVTPISQPTAAAQAAVTKTLATALATTVFSEAKTGMWAFGSSTVAKLYRTRINQAVVDIGALTTLVNRLRTDLVSLGLVKGS